jgi:hypothetical protein
MRLLAINVYTPNGLSNAAALSANQSLHQFLLLVVSGLSPCLAVTDPHRLVDTDSKRAHVRVLVNFNTSLSNRGENSFLRNLSECILKPGFSFSINCTWVSKRANRSAAHILTAAWGP